jgi:hypothetical protein
VGTAMAGATIIAAIGAALISISIDQFIKSQVARPQLVDSLTAAQQDVDLSSFATTKAFATYWALGTAEPTDPSGVPLIEDQCQGFVTTPGSDLQMAPCLGYIKVAKAAQTALGTASGASYQPSFAAPPTISFTAPTSSPFYSKADVQLTARATDPFGVSSLACTDGASPLSLSTTSSDGGNTLDGTTILSATTEGTHTIACGATDKLGFGTPAGLAALHLGRHRQDAAGADRELLAGAERRRLEHVRRERLVRLHRPGLGGRHEHRVVGPARHCRGHDAGEQQHPGLVH